MIPSSRQFLPRDLDEFALLLDVDGTIIEIAVTPDRVVVPEGLCETLSCIQARSGGALAFVSGRRIAELDRLFAPLSLPIIGCHGAEFRAVPETSPETSRVLGDDIKAELAALAAIDPRIMAEDKIYSFAVHYRLAPECEPHLLTAMAEALDHIHREDLVLLKGKAVLEVKFRDVNKGFATRALMHIAPFKGRRPVFVGDDVTDEDVFAVLPEFDGIGISVGRSAPGASYTFERPRDVRDWLRALASQPEQQVQ